MLSCGLSGAELGTCRIFGFLFIKSAYFFKTYFLQPISVLKTPEVHSSRLEWTKYMFEIVLKDLLIELFEDSAFNAHARKFHQLENNHRPWSARSLPIWSHYSKLTLSAQGPWRSHTGTGTGAHRQDLQGDEKVGKRTVWVFLLQGIENLLTTPRALQLLIEGPGTRELHGSEGAGGV